MMRPDPVAPEPMLEMHAITKHFGPVVANDGVDFTVLPGQVHTLLGENGAGKSTLMKVLYGLHQPDSGTILLEGTEVEVPSPSDAIALGIGMIHQHFMLVPTLTVAENVALGLGGRRGMVDLAPVRRRLGEVAERYGLAVDPDAYVWQLAVGERQRAEILKALYREAKLLVLDEPTAVLTPPEVADLFVTLRMMAEDGRALVFISHKLHEVMDISDEITVLRDGRVTGWAQPAETSREELARMMVGRPVQLTPTIAEVTPGEAKLAVRDLRVIGDRETEAVAGVTIEVRAGEIVGVAGVSGNGQRELAEAVLGLRPLDGGEVVIDGEVVTRPTPSSIRSLGIAYVPEERMVHGVVGELNVAENLTLSDYDRAPYARRGMLNFGAIYERARDLVDRYSVRTPNVLTQTRHLSGGNIQKLVVAREFSSGSGMLVVAQPTRGLDIGATEYIHERLLEQRREHAAILLISEDLDEVLALSDRVVVMFEGKVVGEIPRAEVELYKLGLLMSGVDPADKAHEDDPDLDEHEEPV